MRSSPDIVRSQTIYSPGSASETNRAGKTTLINLISGLLDDHDGRVTIDGEDLTGQEPHRIAAHGVGRTFQNLRLFSGLTVRENVEVAWMASGLAATELPNVDTLLVAAGLTETQERRAGELDYGSQRRLELIRAAAGAPKFLLLDEPTSGMGEAESAAMVDFLRSLGDSIGAGLLVIDHDLHFITTICDRIYVLDHGQLIADGSPDVVRDDAAVRAAYLGED